MNMEKVVKAMLQNGIPMDSIRAISEADEATIAAWAKEMADESERKSQ